MELQSGDHHQYKYTYLMNVFINISKKSRFNKWDQQNNATGSALPICSNNHLFLTQMLRSFLGFTFPYVHHIEFTVWDTGHFFHRFIYIPLSQYLGCPGQEVRIKGWDQWVIAYL